MDKYYLTKALNVLLSIKNYEFHSAKSFWIILLLLNHLFSFLQMKRIWKLKKALQIEIIKPLENKNNYQHLKNPRRKLKEPKKSYITIEKKIDDAWTNYSEKSKKSKSLIVSKLLVKFLKEVSGD